MSDTSQPPLYGPNAPAQHAGRASAGRRPRGFVKIGNAQAAFIRADVTNRSHFTSDVYSVTLEPWHQPQAFGLNYWADIDTVQVEVFFGLLPTSAAPNDFPANATSLILGDVDDVDIDPDTGSIVISGRDLSSRLIDARTTNRWPNQTASQIVTHIATDYGLTPNVTATKTPAGQYYSSGYNQVNRETPLWDIVVFLAQQEGFDAYVKGTTLYFGPVEADSDPNPYAVWVGQDQAGRVVSNCTNLSMKRSLTIAGDLQVTVVSHDPVTGKTIKAVQNRAGKHGPRNTASGYAAKQQQYVIRVPNLTTGQATDMAYQMLRDVTKFERVIEFTMEGDPTLTTRRKVRLSGTHSSFDQDYEIDTIQRKLNMSEAFPMTVHAKNHSTESNISEL